MINKNLIKKIVMFLVGGFSTLFVKLGFLFIILKIFGIYYLVSSSLAFVIAVFFNYNFQKHIAFKNYEKTESQFPIFIANCAMNFMINLALIYSLVEYLTLNTYLAQIITTLFIAVYNFYIYGIIFKNKET